MQLNDVPTTRPYNALKEFTVSRYQLVDVYHRTRILSSSVHMVPWFESEL